MNEAALKETFNIAFEIACIAHKGQLDKAGMPYILHPIRIMEKFGSWDLKIVAILHDVIEDSKITEKILYSDGIPLHLANQVGYLSKKPGQSYQEYLNTVNMCSYARLVKMADLKDNMDMLRLDCLCDKDVERFKKYHSAYKFLSR